MDWNRETEKKEEPHSNATPVVKLVIQKYSALNLIFRISAPPLRA
jgi:hypothetical protein